MSCRMRQTGQALAETLVVFGCLASLWLAVAWLGRLQDIDVQLLHASRRAAFAYAHQGMAAQTLADDAAQALNQTPARWQTRQGPGLLQKPAQIALASSQITPDWQVGDPIQDAEALRTELQLGDKTVWQGRAGVQTRGQPPGSLGLRDFDQQALSWQRQTSILRGSGAAAHDNAVQTILEDSAHAWGRWAHPSISLGKTLDARLQNVDAAWGRDRPTWDWIQPWTSALPGQHLSPWEAP